MPWRPGRHYNSQPCTYPGIQTAIVVGPAGTEIHTDGYGRVKVQFHWDRLGNYDENSSPWLRVMSPGAGSEFGNIRLPRVGEEVAVLYLDANIDHPVILGALYNATQMPPWELPGQQALSGLRSRELQGGEGGGGGRGNHLVLDDTAGKIQVQLKSDHQCSQLSLGHITRVEDSNGRKDARGEGWELRTDGHGVLRAGQGMLISTEVRKSAQGPVKDMAETCHRLAAASDQHQLLAETAQKNGAQDNQTDVATALESQIKEIKGTTPGTGGFPEITTPHLILSSPAGIASTTAQSTHIASDLNTAITTGKSFSIAAGDGFFASIRQTFRLFVQKAGVKLIAASGDIDVKALTDNFNLLAKLNITQTANRIVISAKEDILINGGGSYLKLSAGGIEHGTNGTFFAHAASHHFNAAKSMAAPDLEGEVFDVGIKRDLHLEYVDADDQPLQHDPIQAHAWDGHQHNSMLDETGKTTINNISRGSFRAEQTKRM
jgi:type VI secretion system secreted protein VgrG